MKENWVEIYDTTLRDGAQGEGLAYTVEDKLKIARALDEIGVSYIEGGWPGANPKDVEFFERAKSLTGAGEFRGLRQHAAGQCPGRGRFHRAGAAGGANARGDDLRQVLGFSRGHRAQDDA